MELTRKIFKKEDLTEGPVLKNLILFFLPIALGTIFQQLYNAVDAFVVSKYVGTVALAAVGGSPAIVSNLVIGFCVALTSGCSAKISQYYGAKEYDNVKDSIKTSFIFCSILGIVFGALVILFSKEILIFLDTTEDSFELSMVYQKIFFIGTLSLLVFNMGSGILRALGDSTYPFICLFISCVLNIILDFIFVKSFNMGVEGVAYATVISETVSAIMITIKLLITKKEYKLELFKAKFNFDTLKSMLYIGVPAGFQSSMYGASNVILQKGVNSLGTVVVASWAMSGKVDGIYWAIVNAFGIALTTFVGQNYGAKKYKRVREARSKGLKFSIILTLSISAVLMLFGKFILNILTDDNDVIETTYFIMEMFVPLYFLWTIIEVYTGTLRGIGDTLYPSIIQLVGICVFRVIWVYTIFETHHTLLILSLSYSISWLITDISIIIYYNYIKKRKLSFTNE